MGKIRFSLFILLFPLFGHSQALWEDNVAQNFIPGTDDSEILRFLYGSYDAEKEVGILTSPREELISAFNQRPGREDSVQVKALAVQETHGDTQMVYVLTSANFEKNNCEKCKPVLEMAIFRYRDSLWEFRSRKILGSFDQSGKGKPFGFVQLGENHGGFIIRNNLPGTMIDREEIRIFGDYGKGISQLFILSPSKENNLDICEGDDPPCYKFSSKIKVKKASTEYYPIEVKFKGKHLRWDKKLIKKKGKETWTLKNGMYGN